MGLSVSKTGSKLQGYQKPVTRIVLNSLVRDKGAEEGHERGRAVCVKVALNVIANRAWLRIVLETSAHAGYGP